MSRRNKLLKFAEILSFPNVFENFDADNPALIGENGEPIELKGRWNEEVFKNDNPITLELACGKGDYTIGLAQMYPNRNFIGVDIKGARIWRGAKTALEHNLKNVAFLRTRIEQINYFFAEYEVAEIWITFADPFLKKPNRRLTAIPFLRQYLKLLKPGGLVHLKTDSDELYEFTLEEVVPNQKHFKLLYQNSDIYAKPLLLSELEIKTFYEKKHLANGKTIKYVQLQSE